ncbi:MAG: hypothetical protein Q8P24_12520 [Desulfobacterales bacterium]|nr:hypothetical protein [Desulfobacterales bacterium]
MRLNEIYQRYKDQVEFLTIYITEAHPDDGWRSLGNIDVGIAVKQPTTDDERTAVAATCQKELDLQMPMLVDSIDNDVEEKYISRPMRLFLVDANGVLVYVGERGPFGFNPDVWEEAIRCQLATAE